MDPLICMPPLDFAALNSAPGSSENRMDEVRERSQEPEQENDLWKNIKDFAG